MIFAIPVRLDNCDIPYRKLRVKHAVDLFPEEKWNEGINSIIRALKLEDKDKGDEQKVGPNPKRFPKIVIGGIVVAISLIVVFAVVMFAGSHNPPPPVYPSTLDYHPIPDEVINNNPPVVYDSSATTKMNQPIDIKLRVIDKDPNSHLTSSIVSNPLYGRLSNINQSTGTVTYYPYSGFTGTDSFTFKTYDQMEYSDTNATVSITVN